MKKESPAHYFLALSHKVSNRHIIKLPEASLVLLTFLSLLRENYYAFASPNAVRGGGRRITMSAKSAKSVKSAKVTPAPLPAPTPAPSEAPSIATC
eukprot:scaffold10197_cov270-Chaetoceros_neogracile.AAC.14